MVPKKKKKRLSIKKPLKKLHPPGKPEGIWQHSLITFF